MNKKILNMEYPCGSREPEIKDQKDVKASHLSSNPKNEFDDAKFEAEVKAAFFRVFFGF